MGKKKLGPYLLGPNSTEQNGIYTGDARKLAKAIPDESVDLIFTDPVYQNIDDYQWLAETAARILKPGGEMIVYYAQYHFYDTVLALGKHIKVAWPLTEKKIGGAAWMFIYSLSSEVKPLLWCIKGKPETKGRHRIDHYFAKPEGKRKNYKWHKGSIKTARWLRHYSTEQSVILDPFVGGGTIPSACKMLGRRYLAFEIEPDTAELARERVCNTQPPLFTLKHEQRILDL